MQQTRTKQKQRRPQLKVANIAHDIETKERTEDVLTDDNRNKDFSALMLSEPVIKGLR